MHRSGTSLVTRGLKSLGIYLGNDFLETKPGNPTGYWEDRNIVGFNRRVLKVFGLQPESVRAHEGNHALLAFYKDAQWEDPEIEAIRLEAIEYIRANFVSHPLWGFKDPRTARLLPFWSPVFQRLGLEDAYVVVIRNPSSVAQSLFKRRLDAATSHSLWLLHMVPYLSRIAQKRFAVTDYDLLMDDPREQLERIGLALEIPPTDTSSVEIEDFVAKFLDPELRHSQFGRLDCDLLPYPGLLAQKAYLGLSQLATDPIGADRCRFWSEWKEIEGATQRLFENECTLPDQNV